MAVVAEIVQSWRNPRRVIRDRLDDGVREDRALAVLMGACLLIFVAQWPRLARDAYIDPSTPLDMRLGGAMLGWIFLAPLALYLIAAVTHLIAKLLGGQGSWFGARMALFWALLATAPFWLINGLVAGFVGPGLALTVTGVFALAAFLVVWLLATIEAESRGKLEET